jgi:peptidoglycan/LPS O-acetylase OafA/YrhL
MLRSIQGLRAVAALSVALVHFNSLWLILQDRASETMALYTLASGVDVFSSSYTLGF